MVKDFDDQSMGERIDSDRTVVIANREGQSCRCKGADIYQLDDYLIINTSSGAASSSVPGN